MENVNKLPFKIVFFNMDYNPIQLLNNYVEFVKMVICLGIITNFVQIKNAKLKIVNYVIIKKLSIFFIFQWKVCLFMI